MELEAGAPRSRLKGNEFVAVEPGEAFIGADPEISICGLRDGSYRVLR